MIIFRIVAGPLLLQYQPVSTLANLSSGRLMQITGTIHSRGAVWFRLSACYRFLSRPVQLIPIRHSLQIYHCLQSLWNSEVHSFQWFSPPQLSLGWAWSIDVAALSGFCRSRTSFRLGNDRFLVARVSTKARLYNASFDFDWSVRCSAFYGGQGRLQWCRQTGYVRLLAWNCHQMSCL